MDLTCLQIIQAAADRVGVARPAVAVNSTDQQVRQLLGLANEAGAALASQPDQAWQALTKEWTFVTVAAEAQVDAIPEDFGFFLPDCMFNRSQARLMRGPMSAQDWQAMKALNATAPATLLFRERGGVILLAPDPTAGETVAYEYGSSYWATNSAGIPKPAFTSDDDMTLVSGRLMVLSLVWRFKQAKGFDYAEDMRSFELELQRAMGRDGGQTSLNAGTPAWGDMNSLMALNIPQTIPIP